MSREKVACDVASCSAVGFANFRDCFVTSLSGYDDPEGVVCPEGWGVVTLSDSQGELQEHFICPDHVKMTWEFLSTGATGKTSP